jgi:predicted HNH restriction endonuclease
MSRWIRTGVNPTDIQIRWKPVNEWLIDIIPRNVFTDECKRILLEHRIRSFQGKEKYRSRCLLTIKNREAILDYSDKTVLQYNKKRGMRIGVCRIMFTSPNRNLIKRIDWIEDGKEQKNAATSNWSQQEYTDKYIEGGDKEISLEVTKRDPQLKADAIRRYGSACQVCRMDFGETYGDVGEGYIEIHHLKPMASKKSSESLTSIEDVRVVCANCHRMLHRQGKVPIPFDDFLKAYRQRNTENRKKKRAPRK